ncbi:MAG: hypothetical protein SP4CHLAM5_04160 [Chlamydiia bacterium]|nr:hypothetical protein [Chlamydiia bacterium]MCH9618289.1 hypothetical protein [Chlamydiia bacterium]MCH9624162.1 hypothetical protein [Chlamydiia bacterium]
MKRVLLFTLAILLMAIFIPKSRQVDSSNLKQHEMYLTDHQFHFFAVNNPTDTCFTRKIYSMIDQEYDGFDIYLFTQDGNLNDITTYAKKKDKEHLLHIIEVDENAPIQIVMNEMIKSFHPNSVVIKLDKNALFADTKVLSYVNSLFKQARTRLALYSNFTTFPSYQLNKEPLDYETSPLKIHYAGDISPKTYFINTPLYITQSGDRQQGY